MTYRFSQVYGPLHFKSYQFCNWFKMGSCVCDIYDSELPLELDPAVLSLNPGTFSIWKCAYAYIDHKPRKPFFAVMKTVGQGLFSSEFMLNMMSLHIWGSHNGVSEDSSLLGCSTMSLGTRFLMCKRIVMPSFARLCSSRCAVLWIKGTKKLIEILAWNAC